MENKKYKKYHKKKNIHQKERINVSRVNKGFYGLKVLNSGTMNSKQLETMRRIITRVTKRTAKIHINIFFNHPLTKKPSLSRMGKGAGGIDSWIAYVKKGKIIFELNGIPSNVAFSALKLVKDRINLKTKIVSREIIDI